MAATTKVQSLPFQEGEDVLAGTRIISVCHIGEYQVGGTTAVKELGIYLAAQGHRVLLVDCNPNSGLSKSIIQASTEEEWTSFLESSEAGSQCNLVPIWAHYLYKQKTSKPLKPIHPYHWTAATGTHSGAKQVSLHLMYCDPRLDCGLSDAVASFLDADTHSTSVIPSKLHITGSFLAALRAIQTSMGEQPFDYILCDVGGRCPARLAKLITWSSTAVLIPTDAVNKPNRKKPNDRSKGWGYGMIDTLRQWSHDMNQLAFSYHTDGELAVIPEYAREQRRLLTLKNPVLLGFVTRPHGDRPYFRAYMRQVCRYVTLEYLREFQEKGFFRPEVDKFSVQTYTPFVFPIVDEGGPCLAEMAKLTKHIDAMLNETPERTNHCRNLLFLQRCHTLLNSEAMDRRLSQPKLTPEKLAEIADRVREKLRQLLTL